MSRFSKVSPGGQWPSGDYREIALLRVSDSDVSNVFGELIEGTETGLGGWLAIGFQLPDKSLVELIRYKSMPGPAGYIVRLDAPTPTEPSLSSILDLLGVARESLLWIRSEP